jgi:hypothetical protein
VNRKEFDAMDLEGRMRIMKFFCNAKKRWEKTHASKLSLNEYLSWLAAEAQQADKTEQMRDSMIMICFKCDSRMEYAGEGLYKCLRCGNIFKNN